MNEIKSGKQTEELKTMQVRRGEKMEVALEIRIMNCERGLDFYGAISCVVGLVLLV